MSIINRLNECTVRIGNMCSEARPPRMSIPVREDDDDVFITTTCLQAVEEIERLTAERGTLQKTMDEQHDICVKRVIRLLKERNALNYENARLTAAMDRYSADEIRLTKESTIAAQQEQIERLTAERDAAYKKAWQSAAQLCHEMYMVQEYQDKIDYCPDDYAEGVAEGMDKCAKQLAKKAKS